MTADKSFDTVFVGAGPSGIGPLVHAAGAGRLGELLAEPIAVVDGCSELGPGSIGDYLINTNSRGSLFIESLRGEGGARLPRAARSEVAAHIRSQPEVPVSMQALGELLRLLGQDLAGAINSAPGSALLLGRRVDFVRQRDDGTYRLETNGAAGREVLTARQLVLSTGARPSSQTAMRTAVLDRCCAAGAEVLALHSDDFLRHDGKDRALAALARRPGGRVLIIGGGDSAFSAAWLLLQGPLQLGDGAVVIAYRSPPKVTFESAGAARSAGYEDFGAADICAESGILYRIGGLRFDQAELYLRIRSGEERRVWLAPLGGAAISDAGVPWDELAVVVFATGYAPTMVPISDAAGRPLDLRGTHTGKYVDGASRLLLADGEALPNVYAIGMCAGFLPMEGGFGGEPSFDGLANSIMLCHGSVGGGIVRGLLAGRQVRQPTRVATQAGWPA
jgi:hypothetical protein